MAAAGLLCRALGPSQLQACLDLDQTCLGGLWSAANWQQELADPRRPGVGLWRPLPGEATEAEGCPEAIPGADPQLVAMACGWLVVDELHITLVAVDPAWRQRGVGRRVLTALLESARSAGAAHATLEVASSNGPARGLYGALGFATAGCRRGYYRNGDDALIQWLDLRRWDGFG